MNYVYDSVNLIVFPILLLMANTFVSRGIRLSLRNLHRKTYQVLVFPGTSLHELSHALLAVLFGMKVQSIKLWTGNYEGQLGYVRFTYDKRSWFQQMGLFFVGLAPLWVMLMSMMIWFTYSAIELPIYAVSLFDKAHLMEWAVNWASVFKIDLTTMIAVFVIAGLGPFMVPSWADVKIALRGGVMLLLFLVALYLLSEWLDQRYELQMILYNAQSYWVASLMIVLIVSVFVWLTLLCIVQLKKVMR